VPELLPVKGILPQESGPHCAPQCGTILRTKAVLITVAGTAEIESLGPLVGADACQCLDDRRLFAQFPIAKNTTRHAKMYDFDIGDFHGVLIFPHCPQAR